MTTTTDFAKYTTKFFSVYLVHDRHASLNTIESYKTSFIHFIDFMKVKHGISVESITLNELTRENVLAFLRWLVEEKDNALSTRNQRLSAFRSFALFLQYYVVEKMEQWQNILSIKDITTDSKPLNYLTTEGVKLLLDQPDASCPHGLRHLAILSLLFDSGARVQEIADLMVSSIRIDCAPQTLKLFGKGRKSRIVPLSESQVKILYQYMKVFHLLDPVKSQYPLFFSSRGEKLTRSGITYILQKYAVMARRLSSNLIPQRLTCHSLRHSKAMAMVDAGVNIVYIRDFLGHASLQSTDVYARASGKAKKEAFEKASSKISPDPLTEAKWEDNDDLKAWLKRHKK